MEGHAKKCVERHCELSNKTTQQLYKVSTPCIDDQHFKEEEVKSVGELSKICSQIVLKCLHLARIGQLDILWSVNKFARSITKCTKILWQTIISCDLLHSSYMWIQTILSCWETLQNNADWDCFKNSILQEILRIQNLHQVEHCAILEVIRLFRRVGCVRNKLQFRTNQQNLKSFPWMQDWGWMLSPHLIHGILIVTVLGNTNQESQRTEGPVYEQTWSSFKPHTIPTRKQSQGVIDDVDNVDFIPSNVNSSHQEALLYVFEDNEAVIKMIMKGKKPDNETCFENPQSCSWLVNRSNQFGHQIPNQIHRHHKPTCRLAWCLSKETSHVTNGIIFCVCSTSAISVPPIVLRLYRKQRKKIQVKKESQPSRSNNEFDRAKQWKGSISAIFYCIRQPGANQTRKSTSSESVGWEVRQNGENRCLVRRAHRPVVCTLITLLRVEDWSRMEIWWIDGR